jgi:hypothetical protein
LYSAPPTSSSFHYTHTRSISFYSTDTKVLFSKPGSDGWSHFPLPSHFIFASPKSRRICVLGCFTCNSEERFSCHSRTLNPVKGEGYYVVTCNTYLPTKKVFVLNDPGTKVIEVGINRIGEPLLLNKFCEKGFCLECVLEWKDDQNSY